MSTTSASSSIRDAKMDSPSPDHETWRPMIVARPWKSVTGSSAPNAVEMRQRLVVVAHGGSPVVSPRRLELQSDHLGEPVSER